MVTCREKRVKIKSNSPPEQDVDHLHAEEDEYQVQHSPDHHGGHLYAEEGGDKVQHNTEHDGDHL